MLWRLARFAPVGIISPWFGVHGNCHEKTTSGYHLSRGVNDDS